MKEYEFKIYVGSGSNTKKLVTGIRNACIEASENYVQEHTGQFGMIGVEIFKEEIICKKENNE